MKNLLIIFAATLAISPAFSSAVPTAKKTPHKQVFMNKFEHAFKFKQITNKKKTRQQTFEDLFKKFEQLQKK